MREKECKAMRREKEVKESQSNLGSKGSYEADMGFGKKGKAPARVFG